MTSNMLNVSETKTENQIVSYLGARSE